MVVGGPGKGDVLLGKAGDDVLVARDGAVDIMVGGTGFDACYEDNKLHRGDKATDEGESIEKVLKKRPA